MTYDWCRKLDSEKIELKVGPLASEINHLKQKHKKPQNE